MALKTEKDSSISEIFVNGFFRAIDGLAMVSSLQLAVSGFCRRRSQDLGQGTRFMNPITPEFPELQINGNKIANILRNFTANKAPRGTPAFPFQPINCDP